MSWRPAGPDAAAKVMHGYDAPWWIAGGWALDLFTGRTTRPHEDVDVAVLREDQDRLWEHFAGWELQLPNETAWRGERLELPRHNIWARPRGAQQWELELVLQESEGDRWVYRRDPRVTRELSLVGLDRDGIPFLAPELVLLFKSKQPRERDDADLAAVVPDLQTERREWLRSALARRNPAHPWLEQI